MKQQVYLTLENRSTRKAPAPCFAVVGVRKSQPPLSKDQVAVKLNIEIPDSTFKTFIPEINMTIPDEVMVHGGDVDVTAVDPEEVE